MLVAVMSLTCATFASAYDVVQVTAGAAHTCALLDDNSVKCWGLNVFSRMAADDADYLGESPGEMGNNLTKIDLGTGRTAKLLTAGELHTCAILDDNSLKCWGSNVFGQLGLGNNDPHGDGDATDSMGDNLPAVNLGDGRTAKNVTAGKEHTCALLDDNSVKCWGNNEYGQLGYGDTSRRGDGTAPDSMGDNLLAVNLGTGLTAKQVTAGDYHTCALLDDNSVKCWGRGNDGQLGLGYSTGYASTPSSVDLGTHTAKHVTAGKEHTCAILDDNSVKCWGENEYGQLGYGDISKRGSANNDMGDFLPALELGNGRYAKHIHSNGHHTCALLDDNSVKCWGFNQDGQLGIGARYNRGDWSGQMGDDLPAVILGDGRTAKQVTTGGYHTCALLDNNSVKCWGRNSVGQLGLGDKDSRGDAADDMGDFLPALDFGTPSPPPPLPPLPPSPLPPLPPSPPSPLSPPSSSSSSSSSPSPSSSTPSSSKKSSANVGVIAGSVVGAISFTCCVIIVCIRSANRERDDDKADSNTAVAEA